MQVTGVNMGDVMEKSEILTHALVEALPYLRKFRDKTMVVKYGGSAQTDESLKISFAKDIALLSNLNIRVVIVHGGGKEISSISKQLGISSTFVNGQRVTSEEMLDVVVMVLGGKINKEIVGLINQQGVQAVGISGKDGNLLKAKKIVTDNGDDLGWVGEVEIVDAKILNVLLDNGFIPVVSPIGWGDEGKPFNINADVAASAIAKALKAEKLIYISDVPGVMINNERVGSIDQDTAEKHILEEAITGGMIPKVRSAFDTIEGGVNKVHLVDGKTPHALLMELFTDEGIGTQFIS
jgi:acetylglutamate kinase